MGTIKQYVPGNFFGSLFKGGMAFVSKDYIAIMELMIDAEMKMFKGLNTPVIFLQNVITDLLLGLHMKEMLKAYHDYIKRNTMQNRIYYNEYAHVTGCTGKRWN
jgi:hypothetical protein